MTDHIENLLAEVPEEEILYSVSPPAAREFGILPVNIRKPEGSGESILDVVALEGIKRIDETLGWQMFKKIINYVGTVNPSIWKNAYERFYKGLL